MVIRQMDASSPTPCEGFYFGFQISIPFWKPQPCCELGTSYDIAAVWIGLLTDDQNWKWRSFLQEHPKWICIRIQQIESFTICLTQLTRHQAIYGNYRPQYNWWTVHLVNLLGWKNIRNTAEGQLPANRLDLATILPLSILRVWPLIAKIANVNCFASPEGIQLGDGHFDPSQGLEILILVKVWLMTHMTRVPLEDTNIGDV